MISFDEFKKIEIKVARITQVSEHPQADRLYVLKVDTGTQTKQLVAGIKKFYQPQELLNKDVVIVDNMQPATIRGVESQAMMLAASDSAGLTLITPEKPISIGSSVR